MVFGDTEAMDLLKLFGIFQDSDGKKHHSFRTATHL